MAKTKSVTARALVQRINRKLADHGTMGQVLKRTRGMRAYVDLGDYWILDIGRNFVADKHVNIEALGRKLEVLQPSEHLG